MAPVRSKRLFSRSCPAIDAPVLGVDIDEHNGLAAEAGVRSIPTVAVYRGGEEIERFVGVTSADKIRAALK